MSRSNKKGPFVDQKLLKKVMKQKDLVQNMFSKIQNIFGVQQRKFMRIY